MTRLGTSANTGGGFPSSDNDYIHAYLRERFPSTPSAPEQENAAINLQDEADLLLAALSKLVVSTGSGRPSKVRFQLPCSASAKLKAEEGNNGQGSAPPSSAGPSHRVTGNTFHPSRQSSEGSFRLPEKNGTSFYSSCGICGMINHKTTKCFFFGRPGAIPKTMEFPNMSPANLTRFSREKHPLLPRDSILISAPYIPRKKHKGAHGQNTTT